MIVAIDAGHGSNTAGKRTVDGYKEHYINVKVAFYTEQVLKKNGIEVIRVGWNDENSTDDLDESLTNRQLKIKNNKCEYSISCHANAHGNGSQWTNANGVETLYHNDASKCGDSIELAKHIQNHIVKGTSQSNRGIKPQSLAMCNCTAMGTKASVLVEIGFMTNEHEANLMKTDSFCKEQGEDIANGFLAYLSAKGIKTNTKKETINNLPFLVKLKEDLNIRKEPNGQIVKPNGAKKGICYTIIKVSSNGKWGKLKSGVGWICIMEKYVEKI